VGEQQSLALGRWFASLDERQRPTVLFSSPYVRARETADRIRAVDGVLRNAPFIVDERLREKEFGMLDRLTRAGIMQRFPEQAKIRARVGKFYYRAPAGESWTDVILRLRTFADTISLHHSESDSRVLIVAHQVIVLCMRYLIEELDEAAILGIDAQGDVANCGVTDYVLERGRLRLVRYNFTAPLAHQGAPVTAEPDVPAGPR
jgi:broad specificity phosphatase PhoE